MMWRCDEIVTFVPSSKKIVTFLEVLKKLFRNLAASHRTWNVTKCDGNVTSHHFVAVSHSNPGPGSGKIPAWNDPQNGKSSESLRFNTYLSDPPVSILAHSTSRGPGAGQAEGLKLAWKPPRVTRNQLELIRIIPQNTIFFDFSGLSLLFWVY